MRKVKYILDVSGCWNYHKDTRNCICCGQDSYPPGSNLCSNCIKAIEMYKNGKIKNKDIKNSKLMKQKWENKKGE